MIKGKSRKLLYKFVKMDAFRFAQSHRKHLLGKKPAFIRAGAKAAGQVDPKLAEKFKRDLAKEITAPIVTEQKLPVVDEKSFSEERFRQWVKKLLNALITELKGYCKVDGEPLVEEVTFSIISEQFLGPDNLLRSDVDGRAIQRLVYELLHGSKKIIEEERDARILAYAFTEQTWIALTQNKFAPKEPKAIGADGRLKSLVAAKPKQFSRAAPAPLRHQRDHNEKVKNEIKTNEEIEEHDTDNEGQSTKPAWESMIEEIRAQTEREVSHPQQK